MRTLNMIAHLPVSMSTETNPLRELYLDIATEETLTESQEVSPSHEPIEESEREVEQVVADVARQDGLTDAVEGAENMD